MTGVYQIGDFCFEIEMDQEIVLPEHFEAFRCDKPEESNVAHCEELQDCAYYYHITLVEKLPECSGNLLMESPSLLVYGNGIGENRLIFIAGESAPYAYYEETDEEHACIFYLADRLPELQYDTVFVSLLALERRMLGRKGLVLHCAYTVYKGEAILFSAPSGTGKSTQADLWQRYRGSSVINGDRCLLQPENGRWMAKGWPICGSSDICQNRQAPVRAVVLLAQGPGNVACPLSAAKAFSQLYGQITVNRWNRQAGISAMELLEHLIREVPVYHLSCTISQEAVECLARAMGV